VHKFELELSLKGKAHIKEVAMLRADFENQIIALKLEASEKEKKKVAAMNLLNEVHAKRQQDYLDQIDNERFAKAKQFEEINKQHQDVIAAMQRSQT
jgi:hypothetical protein